MDHAEKTMMENLQKITGKSLEEWVEIVKLKHFTASHQNPLRDWAEPEW